MSFFFFFFIKEIIVFFSKLKKKQNKTKPVNRLTGPVHRFFPVLTGFPGFWPVLTTTGFVVETGPAWGPVPGWTGPTGRSGPVFSSLVKPHLYLSRFKEFQFSPKNFFYSIYVPNIFKMFQSYLFDKQHSNYKWEKLIFRSNYDVSDI